MARLGSAYYKSPADLKRYVVNYDHWLDTGENISDINYEVISPIVELTNPFYVDGVSILPDNRSVSLYVGGGNLAITYRVNLTITTDGGQVKEDFILFAVND